MIIDLSESTDPSNPFRSRLELEIAAELDSHQVEWGYEQPVVLPDGWSPRYLPDFTIHDSNPELLLPQWVEGKPQQFIYDLRDSLGVTRRSGERFQGEVIVKGRDHEWLKRSMIDELWKPKYLAELTGEAVLIVGRVGGTSSLTVEMQRDAIVFRRDHPFVNWWAIQRRLEKEAQREEWRRAGEVARRQRQYEWEMHRLRTERDQADRLAAIMSHPHRGQNRLPGRCAGCTADVSAGVGSLYRVDVTGGGSRWFVVCPGCRKTASA